MTASLSSALDCGTNSAVVTGVELGSRVGVGFRVTDLNEQTHTHTNM